MGEKSHGTKTTGEGKQNKLMARLTVAELKSIFSYRRGGVLVLKKDLNYKRRKGDIVTGFKTTTGRKGLLVYGEFWFLSRVVFAIKRGYLPEMVDHKNRNTLDDRITNLRAASRSKNATNHISKKNPHGVRGLYYRKCDKSWIGLVTVNQKTYHTRQSKDRQAVELALKELQRRKFRGFFPKDQHERKV